jgi:hypothetical protein
METVDWDYVRQEVFGKGTTVKQIQREVAPDIAYVKFWRGLRRKAQCPGLTQSSDDPAGSQARGENPDRFL